MYVARPNLMPSPEVRRLAAAVGALDLVTQGPDGFPVSTRLPFVWEGDLVRMHLARANPQWRSWADAGGEVPALAIITGPEAYVSPGFYPAKAEHGRVVPTWNYSAIHLTGLVRIVGGPVGAAQEAGTGAHARAQMLDQLRDLTAQHEAAEPAPWQVQDAPADFIEQQLRAIVGVELRVVRVEAKAKRSQNRDDADHAGVVAGLRARPGGGRDQAVAAQMQVDRGSRD